MDEDPEPTLYTIELGSHHIDSYMTSLKVSLQLPPTQLALPKEYRV